jgi:hypothetical protein
MITNGPAIKRGINPNQPNRRVTLGDIEASDSVNPIGTLEVLETHEPYRFEVEWLGERARNSVGPPWPRVAAPIQENDKVPVSPVSAAPIVLLGHALQNSFLRIVRAGSIGPSINDHDVLGPESLFCDGIEDKTVAARRVGHDVEAVAPRTVIEDGRDEPVSREFAREHAPEIAVRPPSFKDRRSIDEDVAKRGLGLLERESEVPEPPYVVSHDDPTDVDTGHVRLEELSLSSSSRGIPHAQNHA